MAPLELFRFALLLYVIDRQVVNAKVAKAQKLKLQRQPFLKNLFPTRGWKLTHLRLAYVQFSRYSCCICVSGLKCLVFYLKALSLSVMSTLLMKGLNYGNSLASCIKGYDTR